MVRTYTIGEEELREVIKAGAFSKHGLNVKRPEDTDLVWLELDDTVDGLVATLTIDEDGAAPAYLDD